MPDAVSPDTPDQVRFSEMFRAVAAQQDMDDFHHSVSGADVGRIQRHGVRLEIDPLTGHKKGSAAQRAARTLDWLLANDMLYAQAYDAASREVAVTFERASDILERLLREQETVSDQLEEVLDNAATLSDGRKVFKDKNGVVRDADGNAIDDVLAAEIIWTGHEPSYEAYVALRDRAERIDAAILEVRSIETELGGLQGRLEDNDAPIDRDDLDDFKSRANEFDAQLDNIEKQAELVVDRDQNAVSASLNNAAPATKIVLPGVLN